MYEWPEIAKIYGWTITDMFQGILALLGLKLVTFGPKSPKIMSKSPISTLGHSNDFTNPDRARTAGDTYNRQGCISRDMFQGILTLFWADIGQILPKISKKYVETTNFHLRSLK